MPLCVLLGCRQGAEGAGSVGSGALSPGQGASRRIVMIQFETHMYHFPGFVAHGRDLQSDDPRRDRRGAERAREVRIRPCAHVWSPASRAHCLFPTGWSQRPQQASPSTTKCKRKPAPPPKAGERRAHRPPRRRRSRPPPRPRPARARQVRSRRRRRCRSALASSCVLAAWFGSVLSAFLALMTHDPRPTSKESLLCFCLCLAASLLHTTAIIS